MEERGDDRCGWGGGLRSEVGALQRVLELRDPFADVVALGVGLEERRKGGGALWRRAGKVRGAFGSLAQSVPCSVDAWRASGVR